MDKKLTRPQIRKLKRLARTEMHYWQMMARMEVRWYKGSTDNVRHYAAELRRLQQLEDKA